LLEDIELQVSSFFTNSAAYKKLGLRHRRGLLFAGPPGTGKTMMLRRLIHNFLLENQPTTIPTPLLPITFNHTTGSGLRWVGSRD